MLVALSEQLATAGTAGAFSVRTSAEAVRSFRDSGSVVGVLAFSIGATIYYLVFYRSQLIPRWLSGWGLAGTALGLVAGLLVMFRVTGTMLGFQVALNIPIGVQELVLAGWLILKGFSPTPPESAIVEWHPPVAPASTTSAS